MVILFLICSGARPDMMDGLLLWMLTGTLLSFFLSLYSFDYLNFNTSLQWDGSMAVNI